MNYNQYIELRQTILWNSVSLGYMSVTLFKVDKLAKEQIGYSIDPKGNSLCGSNPGDWQDSWLVIGYDGLIGDPLFVELASAELPVYTAPHGEGSWEPTLIAHSFSNFALALQQIQAVSRKRKTPVALAKNPLPQEEVKAITRRIRQDNPNASPFFWESWFEEQSF